jgi:CBS domain-containing protein
MTQVMKIKDVMTTKVIKIQAKEKFHNIIRILVKNKISGAPVVNSKDKVVGIISEKDLIMHLFPNQYDFYSDTAYYMEGGHIVEEADDIRFLRAKDIMIRDVITVSPEDDILHACALMMVNNIRRLLVMENNKLVGIVSTRDIYRNFLYNLI